MTDTSTRHGNGFNRQELEAILADALNLLAVHESSLFGVPGIERTLAGHLQSYLKRDPRLAGWDVDGEYDRDGDQKKRPIDYPKEHARVDIVVHRRGRHENPQNLLAIECKLHSAKSDDVESDREKLTALRTDPRFAYRFTALVTFGVVSSPTRCRVELIARCET